MEVLVICSVKLVQTIRYILGSVAVNDIEQDGNAHAMSNVDQLHKVFWQTVSTASSEEAVDLVSKTRVVCVFHDRHELNSVVAKSTNAR